MNKKIVFFDIDGTIYDYKRGIPQSTVSAIKQLKKNGHLAVICTGRTKIMVFDNILKLGFNGLIAGGGTYVEYNNNMIFNHFLPRDEVKELVESMRIFGFIPIPEGRDNLYFNISELNDDFKFIYNIYNNEIPGKILPIDYNTINAAKVSARFTANSNWNGIYNKLSDKYIFVNHNNNLLEAIPKDFSKADGVKRLIDYLQIDRENTYAFGDSFNDLEMLLYVEHGIVMGNADPNLKGMVKYKTTGMFNDGIYNGLKDFGLI